MTPTALVAPSGRTSPQPVTAAVKPSIASRQPPANRQWAGWLAVLAVAAFPVAEAARIIGQRSHVVLDGDQALLELGVRRAAHFQQLVGPYSRVGIHQPGPAVFYLLAPFVRILGPNGPGLYLGAIAISGAPLIAAVAYLWRRVGPVPALWAAVAVDLYCLSLRVGTLREPWNPYLVAAPMVLFVVLWAAGITGSPGAGLWALVIGSYEVQTHIATAGLVVTMSLILLVWMAVKAWPARPLGSPSPRCGPARLTGGVALVLIWLAPVIELWRDQPNNLNLLWNFFTTAHSTPAFGQALKTAASGLTIMPFGYTDYALTLNRSNTELAVAAAVMALGVVIAVTLGVRRHQPLSVALAASAVLGAALGVISLARTPGPVYLYFAVWLAFVPLSLLLAIGVALLAPGDLLPGSPSRGAAASSGGRIHRPTRPVLALCLIAAVAAGAFTVQSDLRMGPVKTIASGAGPWPLANAGSPQGRARSLQDTAALTKAALSVLGPQDHWVNFTVGTDGLWPYVAGMVLELDQRGTQSTVSPAPWQLYFGHERAPGRAVSIEFDVFASADAAAQSPARGAVLAEIDGAVLTYQRRSAE